MAMLRLAGFSGMWPIRDTRALPDNAASYAMNIRAEFPAMITGRVREIVLDLESISDGSLR